MALDAQFISNPISTTLTVNNALATQVTTGTITTISYVKLGVLKFTASTDVSSVQVGHFMTLTGAVKAGNNGTFFILYKSGSDIYVRHEINHILTTNTVYDETGLTASAVFYSITDTTLVTGKSVVGSVVEQINIVGYNLNPCPIAFYNNSKLICLVILEPFEGVIKLPRSVLMIQGNEFSEPLYDYIQTGQGGLAIKPDLTLSAKAYVSSLESINIQVIAMDF